MAAGMRYRERTTLTKRNLKLINMASPREMAIVGTTPKTMNLRVVSTACQTRGSANILW